MAAACNFSTRKSEDKLTHKDWPFAMNLIGAGLGKRWVIHTFVVVSHDELGTNFLILHKYEFLPI